MCLDSVWDVHSDMFEIYDQFEMRDVHKQERERDREHIAQMTLHFTQATGGISSIRFYLIEMEC